MAVLVIFQAKGNSQDLLAPQRQDACRCDSDGPSRMKWSSVH
jgi:hypothetical protein